MGNLNCFLRNWEASESLRWHNILSKVLESAPSLLFPPCISRPLADFKSSINSRVCKNKDIQKELFVDKGKRFSTNYNHDTKSYRESFRNQVNSCPISLMFIYLFMQTDKATGTNLVAMQLYHLPNTCYLIFNNASGKPIPSRYKKLLQDTTTMNSIKVKRKENLLCSRTTSPSCFHFTLMQESLMAPIKGQKRLHKSQISIWLQNFWRLPQATLMPSQSHFCHRRKLLFLTTEETGNDLSMAIHLLL